MPAAPDSVPSSELPPEVVNCLKNARYLHLSTSDGLWPHVSLMNYTYLPSTPFALPPTPINTHPITTSGPVIILTTQPHTKKTCNLTSNPRVSLLVHDWVSHRSPSFSNPLSSSPPTAPTAEHPHTSPLAQLLTNLNTAALSSISATMFGYAHVIEQGTEDEKYYKQLHSENNPGGEGKCYLDAEDLRVVVVRIAWTRVADHEGGVKDWVSEGEEGAREAFEQGGGGADHGAASGASASGGVDSEGGVDASTASAVETTLEGAAARINGF